ncbi:MAG: YfcE family phosphodiesterase [Patescibacteria group bacterium]
MKVAIISDIHDNSLNLKKSLAWCEKNKIKELICCGDITNSDTLRYLAENFLGKINLARGNMEIFEETEVGQYKNINYLGLFGAVKFDNKKIGICHKPELIVEVKKLGHCDLIFYGHTHQPWIKKEKGITIANPGTLGGVFYKASFGVCDSETGNLELKLLELL